jgi:hypothetical protein
VKQLAKNETLRNFGVDNQAEAVIVAKEPRGTSDYGYDHSDSKNRGHS